MAIRFFNGLLFELTVEGATGFPVPLNQRKQVIMKLMNSFAGRSLLLGALAISVFAGGSSAFAQEERKVSHILIESKARAEEIRKEVITAGGDAKAFKAACYKYSKDATTKPLGGNLGFIRQNSGYDAAFSAAAFNLETGGISGPVLTQFGWHLIHVSEVKKAAPTSTEAKKPAEDPVQTAARLAAEKAAAAKAAAAKTTGEKPSAPEKPATTPPAVPQVTRPVQPATPEEARAAQAASDAKAALQKPVARRRPLATTRKVVLTMESLLSSSSPRGSQLGFRKGSAVELNLTLKNEGKSDQRLPASVLLPLGFEITRLSDNKLIAGNFSGLAEPANYFVTLKSYEIIGLAISLNDYFPNLTPSGRYSLNWSGAVFCRNLEARFAKARDLPDYPGLKSELLKNNSLRTRKIFLDRSANRSTSVGNDFEFSLFGTVSNAVKYYARVKFSTSTDPVVFELSGSSRGNHFAMRHFINLANEGFYDRLNFYDVQAGDYALGGCSSRNGMGVPPVRMANLKNDDGVKHTAGTVSFVTRVSSRQGNSRGGEVGSIFFVSLKDHPEWDTVHVPIGRVVEGLDVIEKLTPQTLFESVVVLSAAEYRGESPDAAALAATTPSPPPPDSKSGTTLENPEARIKTSKGDLEVTLFENNCYSTVASFVTLAEQDFFSKAKDGSKMTFYEAIEQEGKNLCLITGSPTNDGDGDPGYKLLDEKTKHKCERGSLVMLKQYDPETEGYAANSSGSQFFICTQDIPYFDVTYDFTVFGKVTKGLEVLDKLQKGDALEGIEVLKKKKHAYGNIRKVK